MKPPPTKPIPRPPWVQDNSIDQVPMCAQSSPGSNHPGHGFGDCNAECSSSSSSSRNSCCRSPVPPSSNLPSLDVGDIVLVRCNQSKWLGGQVKLISNAGVKVWIGAAEALVDVPRELFPTHLARLGCTTPCSSPRDCHSTGPPVIKVRVPVVRPAHLAHRHLHQIISPESSVANSPSSQMHQAQAPKDPRMTRRYCHYVSPPPDQRPSTVPDHVAAAFFEKKKSPVPHPPGHYILKRSGSTSELLNTVREDSNVKFDGHEGHSDLQAQARAQAQAQALSHEFRSKFHIQAQDQALSHEVRSQFHIQAQAQAEAHSQAVAQFQFHVQAQAQAEAQSQFHVQAQAQLAEDQSQFHFQAQAQAYLQAHHQALAQAQIEAQAQAQAHIEAQYQVHIQAQALAQAQCCWRQHLARSNHQGNKPTYPRPSELPMLNVNLNEGTSPRSHNKFRGSHTAITPESLEENLFDLPLLKPQYEHFVTPRSPTRTAALLSVKDRPPTPGASVKGKERCEEDACSKWVQGTDLVQLRRQGIPLERSISLDSYQLPAFPGLMGDPRSPGARPAKSATFSAEPVWVTVIDNARKS